MKLLLSTEIGKDNFLTINLSKNKDKKLSETIEKAYTDMACIMMQYMRKSMTNKTEKCDHG